MHFPEMGIRASGYDVEPATAARRDLVLLFVATGLFWAASVALELSERVDAWTRPWERYQLDELPGVLLFLAVALAWYSWRRIREVRTQLALRTLAESRLAESLAENRRLSLSHVRAQEDERKQLARELHDELGQHLNAIKIDAVSLRNWSEDRMPEAHQAAAGIVQATDHIQGIVRDMLQRMRPVGLDELGLSGALEHLLQRWRVRHPQTRADLAISGEIDDLGEAENIALYRVVQEALTNVDRHARAGRVRVQVERDVRAVMLSVTDDGAGMDERNTGEGLGLIGMRERVEALGGSFEAGAIAEPGFRIRISIPAPQRAS